MYLLEVWTHIRHMAPASVQHVDMRDSVLTGMLLALVGRCIALIDLFLKFQNLSI